MKLIRLLTVITSTIIVLSLAACGGTTVTPAGVTGTTSAQNPIASSPGAGNTTGFQKYGGAGATLFGMVTYALANQTFEYVTDFTIPAVNIGWENNIFNGQREEAGPGEDVQDNIHGSLSTDGKYLDSFMFSRQIIRINSNDGTSYRITLKNIPLSEQAVGTPPFPGFELNGPDIQKYIVSIEYAEGLLSDGKIVSTTKYVSTDWKNTRAGMIPKLKIVFKDSGEGLPYTGH